MSTTDDQSLTTDDLPLWIQVLGGVWCLLAVIMFVRQILNAYVTYLSGG